LGITSPAEPSRAEPTGVTPFVKNSSLRYPPFGHGGDISARKNHGQSMHARALPKNFHGQMEGNFENSLWRHSSRKRKQLTGHERSPLGRQECRGRSAVSRFVHSE
jgi:hypothetical protein